MVYNGTDESNWFLKQTEVAKMSKEQHYAALHYDPNHFSCYDPEFQHTKSSAPKPFKPKCYVIAEAPVQWPKDKGRSFIVGSASVQTKSGKSAYYQAGVGAVFQNMHSEAKEWHEHKLDDLDIYGYRDGVFFITKPYLRATTGFMPMQIRTSEGWIDTCPSLIVNLICEAYRAKKVTLFDYDCHKLSHCHR
jgi:hypothetical protein